LDRRKSGFAFLCEKLLTLRKACENRQDGLWPAFKIGGLALAAFKISKLALAGFQKLSAQVREICYPIGAKDLNLPNLKSFSQIQKLFVLNSKEFINSI
jgi:predicted component of type VI protein secretion system